MLLGWALDEVQRRDLDAAQTNDAVARVESLLTPYADLLASGKRPSAEQQRAISKGVLVVNDVVGVRLYDDRARVLIGRAPAVTDALRRALSNEKIVTVDSPTERQAYAPLAASNGKGTYVVDVLLSRALLDSSAKHDEWIIAAVTAAALALVFGSLVVLAAGASRELERRRRESESTFVDALGLMARTLDLRDPYTAGHSERVAVYARAIARELRLSERDVTVVHSAALLHDLGKIAIPDSILFKPAKLDPDERHVIELHPVVGANLLGTIASMEDIVPCVLHHHEKVDGSGYPEHLREDAIPLGARIIAVADAFDAMTTDRPYRRGLSISAAMAEIARNTGHQFDEGCALAFGRCIERGEIVPPPSRDDAVFGRKLEISS